LVFVTFSTPLLLYKKSPALQTGQIKLVTELIISPLQSVPVKAGQAGKFISKFTLSVNTRILTNIKT